MKITASIHSLTEDGFGIGDHGEKIPYVLPGEIISAEKIIQKDYPDRYELREILDKSSDRQTPPCVYFGRCGGCQLQHLIPKAYETFKREQIQKQLFDHNIETKPSVFHKVSPKSRRRVTFKARNHHGNIELGYFRLQSHVLVNINHCLLLTTKIQALIPALKDLLNVFFTDDKPKNITITQADNGLDLNLETKTKNLPLEALEKITDFTYKHDLCRFSLNGQIILERHKPQIKIEDVWIDIEPDSFLQASLESNKKLTEIILTYLEGKKISHIADLFAGRGTFSIPLSAFTKVKAFESDQKAVLALQQALTLYPKNINIFARDLYKNPLTKDELATYNLVVINPPRTGAYAQTKMLADSDVSTIIYVSCNAKTFARDAKLLIDQGFKIKNLELLDQFLWSIHTELIAYFEKI
jgi:23S rRNA (uracil1939-C5)-methyltransferase